jgi:hypothetical protein
MNPSTVPGVGREGHRKADTLNITSHWEKRNASESPLAFYEQFLLCRLMVSGNRVKYKHFTDPRNKLIYENLAYLQIQEYRPGVNSLIRYLGECGLLNQAGGEGYIRSIFRGVPEGVFYER